MIKFSSLIKRIIFYAIIVIIAFFSLKINPICLNKAPGKIIYNFQYIICSVSFYILFLSILALALDALISGVRSFFLKIKETLHKSQKGINNVSIVGIILVLAIAGGAGYYLAKQETSNNPQNQSQADSQNQNNNQNQQQNNTQDIEDENDNLDKKISQIWEKDIDNIKETDLSMEDKETMLKQAYKDNKYTITGDKITYNRDSYIETIKINKVIYASFRNPLEKDYLFILYREGDSHSLIWDHVTLLLFDKNKKLLSPSVEETFYADGVKLYYYYCEKEGVYYVVANEESYPSGGYDTGALELIKFEKDKFTNIQEVNPYSYINQVETRYRFVMNEKNILLYKWTDYYNDPNFKCLEPDCIDSFKAAGSNIQLVFYKKMIFNNQTCRLEYSEQRLD